MQRQFFPDILTDKDLIKLKEIATETRLYDNTPDKFVRQAFDKSGSETTLLETTPGDKERTLKNKVIVRHIGLEPYLNWKRTYESVDFWKDRGFDYVPTEPIVGVLSHKDPLKISVLARVLNGPTVARWEKEGGTFIKEIRLQVDHIKKALIDLNIEHGHTHDSNFVVMFPRLENGEADISKPPRVYVIDFDAAKSSGK